MKIMLISINYWPEVTGIGAFTTYRAEYLARAGHDVEVCTTYPYYPEWRVKDSYRRKFWFSESRYSVKIFRVWSYIPQKVRSLTRIIHEGSFALSILIRALFIAKPDVMLVVSPPLGLAIVAIVLSKIWGVPYVFDVEDLQPDSAADMGMLPKWMIKILYSIEDAAYSHAALISTITKGMSEKIASKGSWGDKIVLFEPRMDPSLLDLSSFDADNFREKYNLKNKFIVTHSGNIGVKQALTTLIECAAIVKLNQKIVFLLIGDGAMKEDIQKKAENAGLDNVMFLPLLGEADYRGALAASGVCVVTQQKMVSEIAFPSKIVSYLSAGCPVIVSANKNSEVSLVVRDSGAGMVVPAEDALLLADAIQNIMKQDISNLKIKARNYACMRWSESRVLRYIEKCLVGASGNFVHYATQEEEN